MSVLVRLKADDDALKNVEAMLHGVKGGVEKVTMRAINRALGSGKTALSKGIRETYTVNAATVNETISIRKASASNLEGTIVSSGKPLSARHFSHSPEGKDTTGAERKRIRVTVKRAGAASTRRALFGMADGVRISTPSTSGLAERSRLQRAITQERGTRSTRSRRCPVPRCLRWLVMTVYENASKSVCRKSL